MLLQRACLMGAVLERLPREVALTQVAPEGWAAFWMVCAAKVTSEQIIRFDYANLTAQPFVKEANAQDNYESYRPFRGNGLRLRCT